MTFEQYYELTVRMFRSMATGIFIYPLFVAVASSFDMNVHHYLPQAKVIHMGMAFILLSVIFFPLSSMLEPYFTRGCHEGEILGKKMFIAAVISMGISELIAIFGIIIFVVSGDVRYFYLYFIMAFLHLLLNRPKHDLWQKRLDKAIRP